MKSKKRKTNEPILRYGITNVLTEVFNRAVAQDFHLKLFWERRISDPDFYVHLNLTCAPEEFPEEEALEIVRIMKQLEETHFADGVH